MRRPPRPRSRGHRIVTVFMLFVLMSAASLPSSAVDAGIESNAEVVVVQDVTAGARCRIVGETYADEAHTQFLDSTTSSCPPGTILHTSRTTLADATARDLPFVVITGDERVDRVAIDTLKEQVFDSIAGQQADSKHAGQRSVSRVAACGAAYYVRYLQYWTFAEGANVETAVYYKYNTYDCDGTIFIYQSRVVLLDALNPGHNLYWDQEYVDWSASFPSWDMLCKTVSQSPKYEYMGENWKAWSGTRFIDETINEDWPNCDWYGEEYTASIYLDT